MSGRRKVGGSKPGEKRGNAGKGRKSGVPNKVTKALKDMILGALDAAGEEVEPGGGGQAYLVTQARENPVAFLSLVGKVLPQDIQASVAHTLTSRTVEVPVDE